MIVKTLVAALTVLAVMVSAVVVAMSDAALIQIVTAIAGTMAGILSLIGVIFTAWIGYRMAVLAAEQKTIDAKVTRVEEKTAIIADNSLKAAKWSNALVCSQLKRTADLEREKAGRTKLPGDIERANEADRLLAEHLAQQAKMDLQEHGNTEK